MGDVKTNTARFPKDELTQLVGPESGDWGVMTTELDLEDGTKLPAYGIGHRRGGIVHTFLSTFGKTILGTPQKHKDDDLDADTGFIIARKCPEVLNDATLAQPKIDATNKKRQFLLAFERRFRTQSFPFRAFCSLHLGQSLVDTYYGHNYINKTASVEWNDAMRRAFYAMIFNKLDAIEAGDVEPDDFFEPPAEKAGAKRAQKVKKPEAEHQCVPFIFVPGYPKDAGKKQQWCIVCKARKVTTACLGCSDSPLFFAIRIRLAPPVTHAGRSIAASPKSTRPSALPPARRSATPRRLPPRRRRNAPTRAAAHRLPRLSLPTMTSASQMARSVSTAAISTARASHTRPRTALLPATIPISRLRKLKTTRWHQ